MSEGARKPLVRWLALAPDMNELARARRFVSDAAAGAEFSESRVFDIAVASSEAAANAIEHAPVKDEVTIKTLLYDDRLEIQVQGPGEFQAPRRLADAQSHRGLGLPLMAQFSDHLALYSGPSGGTLVSLTFYRAGAVKADGEPLPPSAQEMIEENELVSAIAGNAPVGLYVLDPDLRYRWANPAYRAFLDEPFRSSDLSGIPVDQTVPGLAERGVLDELRQVSRTGIPIGPKDCPLQGLSRGLTWWRRAVMPLKGENLHPPYDLLVVLSDETERKHTEEQLLREQERLQLDKALFRGAADILEEALRGRGEAELGKVCLEVAQEASGSSIGFVGEIGSDGNLRVIAASNLGWEECRMLGGPRGQPIPKGSEVRGPCGEVLRRGETILINRSSTCLEDSDPAGDHSPLRNFLAVPLKKSDVTFGMIAVANRPGDYGAEQRDVLEALAPLVVEAFERKRVEEKLRGSEEKYRDLFSSLDQGFLLLDVLFDGEGRAHDLRVVEANPAATRMLGRDLVGCRVRELAPAFAVDWYDPFGRVAITGESVGLRHYSQYDDRWYDLRAFRVDPAAGRRIGVTFLDVTAEVRAESDAAVISDVDTILSGSAPTEEVVAQVGVRLGAHLGVDNFMLAEAEETSDRACVLYAWRGDRAVELLHTYRLSELNGPEYWQAMHSGEPFTVPDTQRDPRTNAKRHGEFRVGACVVVPFDRDGRWKYLVSVDTCGPRNWTSREVALVKEVGVRVIARVERARAEEELLRSRERYAFLLRFTDSMRPLSDPAAIQEAAAGLLGRYLGVDRCAYAEVEGEDLAVKGQYARGAPALPSRLGPGEGQNAGLRSLSMASGATIGRGRCLAIADVETDESLDKEEREQLLASRIGALAGAMVFRDERPVASLVCHCEQPRPWGEEELELIREVAQRTWAAAERVKAEAALRESEERYRTLAEENERLFRQQLHIAEHLQTALLNIPSDIGRVRLGHLYRSATEAAKVGGDFYDVFPVKDDNIAILMGDVAGHGIQAARTGTLVKDVVHAFTHQSIRAHEVLKRTNLLLIEKDLPGFVTLFLGILDPSAGVLRYSSAGHPESMVRRLSGDIEMLGCGTSPLGVFPDASWKPHEIRLSAGDVLLLYSDGVTEARRDDELFGEKRLERLLKRKRVSVGRLPHLILDQVLAFSGGTLQDDAAVLALSLTEAPEPAPEAQLRLPTGA